MGSGYFDYPKIKGFLGIGPGLRFLLTRITTMPMKNGKEERVIERRESEERAAKFFSESTKKRSGKLLSTPLKDIEQN